MTNYRSDEYSKESMELLDVTFVSNSFNAILIPGQLDKDSPMKLGCQERVTLYFILTIANTEDTTGVYRMDEIKFCDESNLTSPHYGGKIIDFLCLDHSFEVVKVKVLF